MTNFQYMLGDGTTTDPSNNRLDTKGKRQGRRNRVHDGRRSKKGKTLQKQEACSSSSVTFSCGDEPEIVNLRGCRKIRGAYQERFSNNQEPFFNKKRCGDNKLDTADNLSETKIGSLKLNGGRDRATIHAPHHFIPKKTKIYAALDLGTNNCRLLIATPTRPGRFRALDRFSRIVRLGEGIGCCECLSEAAMERAMEALAVCRTKLESWPVHRQRLIATQACRQALNGDEFLSKVRRQLGLELEIVSHETEARLAVAGCSSLVGRDADALVLFDIGGGSSEIALIDMSKRRSHLLAEHIIAWTSLPVGVVTLAEQFGSRCINTHDFAAMKNHVKMMIEQFDGRNSLGDLVHSPSFHLIGTSGTMTTLAGVHLQLERYDRRRIDGVWMCGEDVTRMTECLLSWDIEQRIANPCIGAERADFVLAGCAILEAIRSHWPSQRLRVADRGLRDGILMELMSCAAT